MSSTRVAGVLWLVAGLTSALIAFFLDQPLDLALFIGGAVLAVALGLALLVRPSAGLVRWSSLLGVAWLLAYGAIIVTRLYLPLEQLVSVVWVAGFGVAGAVVAYTRRTNLDPR